jgi:hypothetical protein
VTVRINLTHLAIGLSVLVAAVIARQIPEIKRYVTMESM